MSKIMIMSKENILEFKTVVDWKKFFYIIGVVSSVLILAKLFPEKGTIDSWAFTITIIILFSSLLIIKAYLDFLINKSIHKTPELSLKQIRLKKLKKIIK